MPHPRFVALLILALAIACSHDEPFRTPEEGTDQPRDAAAPIRLTYNERDDRTASWLPDGSGIIFSSERPDRRDEDRCLAILPPTGGRIERYLCSLQPRHDNRTDVMESPAVSSEGRIVYLATDSDTFQVKRSGSEMVLGRVDDPNERHVLTNVPILGPSGRSYNLFGYTRWLSPTRFVFLTQDLFYEGSTHLPDTFTTGLEVLRADLEGDRAVFSPVPGTDYASSVSAGDSEDVIYYTLGGDSRVYRQNLVTAERAVVWDFGPGQVVRDAHVVGDRLAAIVGRSVLYRFEDAHGWTQRDEGGDLHVVSLSSGPLAVFAYDTVLFHRPMLSPAGDRVVVEAAPYAPVHDRAESGFTAINHRHDLWLFPLP